VDPAKRRRRRRTKAVWRVVNPPTRLLAGIMPWWVLLETTGRRTGRARRTPLAAGPRDHLGMWLIATHGSHADYVANLIAQPRIRLRYLARWYAGTAAVHELCPDIVARFNPYARGALRIAIDPQLVRVSFGPLSEERNAVSGVG
jgi:deazaflavin-dependent oxidoreductase (nitroreductase family)